MEGGKTNFPFYVCLFYLFGPVLARPMTSDRLNRYSDGDYTAVFDRLKSGDASAWGDYGDEVLSAVNQMVENDLADNPFDALLVLFYPEMSAQERKETVLEYEPTLRALINQPMVGTKDRRTIEKKEENRSDSSANRAIDLTIQEDEETKRLQNALKQLRMGYTAEDRIPDFVIEQRNEGNGQKETPAYLGTHESPQGIWWRS